MSEGTTVAEVEVLKDKLNHLEDQIDDVRWKYEGIEEPDVEGIITKTYERRITDMERRIWRLENLSHQCRCPACADVAVPA